MAKDSTPRPLWKKLLRIVFAIGGLLAVVIVVAPLFIPWDKLKIQATDYASKTLGRQLTVGSVEASVFTGVRLKGISLANAKGLAKEPLFANDEASLSLSIFSLFTGKVVIKAIEFKSPRLVYVKGEGRNSLSGLGSKAASKGGTAAADKGKGASSELPVIIAAFKISDGELVYRDLDKGTETSVKGLNLGLYGFSLQAGGASRLELAMDALVEGKKIPFELTSNFALDLAGSSVDLKSLSVVLPGVKVDGSGSVSHFDGDPSLDLKLGLLVLVEKAIRDLCPPSTLKSLPPDLELSGEVAAQLSVKGRTSAPKAMAMNGTLEFKGVHAGVKGQPGLKDLRGMLEIDSSHATLKGLEMELGGSPVKLEARADWGSVDNLMAKRLSLTYKLSSPKLVVDPLMALGGEEAAASDDATAAASAAPAPNGGIADYSKSVPKGLRVKGEVDVAAIHALKIKTGRFTNQLQIQDQQARSVTTLELYEGSFKAESNFDLGQPGPAYAYKIALKGLQLERLVEDAAASLPKKKALQEIKGKLTGRLGLSLDAKGRGLQAPAHLQNLQGNGRFELRDGVLRKLELQSKLGGAIPHEPTRKVIEQDLKFGQMLGEFSLGSNRLNLKSFAMGSGADWREGELFAQAVGWMTLGGGALDFKIVPHFNPRVVQLQGELATAFADDKGWATYDPILYAGPSSTEAKADFREGATKAVRKVVDKKVDEAKQKAQEELKKQAEEKGKDLLKNLPGGLNGLFGK